MLIGTENSHFRKYITTLGVSLIAGAISLAGLFFKLQADLLVESSKFNALTPTAQRALTRRQVYLDWAMTALPYALGIIVMAGFSMALFGLRGWARRQKVADTKEERESQKLEVEIRNLTTQEKEEKIDKEVREAIEQKDASSLRYKILQPSPSALKSSQGRVPGQGFDDIRNRIRHITYQVADLAQSLYGPDRVSQDLVVEGDARVTPDLVVRSSPDSVGYVFEIKYLSSVAKNLRNRLSDGSMSTLRAARLVSQARRQQHEPVLLLVYEDSEFEIIKQRLGCELASLAPSFSAMPLVLAVGRLSLAELKPSELAEALRTD